MPLRPRIIFDAPTASPPFPGWARVGATLQRPDEAGFFAGAALAALHPIARDDHPIGILWRQRLALMSAAVLVRQLGRSEDEAALRDAFYLRRPTDDPGPAGKILIAWRRLGEPAALISDNWPHLLATMFALGIDGAFEELMVTAGGLSKGEGRAIAAAAGIAAASIRLRPDCEMMALWLADAVLAAKLKWPVPVPLLAGPFLSRRALRAAPLHGGDNGAWLSACCLAYAHAAARAVNLHADLSRRAQKLIAATPKLRSKDADAMVARLLSEDAHAAAAGKATGERSARRLFDRLEDLGAVRELTGRPTFRLYGL